MNPTNKIVTTYAKSLFQNVKTNPIFEQFEEGASIGKLTLSEEKKKNPDIFFIGEELLFIRSFILSSKSFKKFFENPTYSDQQKLEILLNIFPGLSFPLKSFLKVLVERSHLFFLPQISDEYTKTLISFRNSTNVKIFTASGLKENSGIFLLNALKKLTNSKEIVLSVFYNPKLLGGLIVEYNSKSIDASILKEFSLFFNEI
jgi:ATP synthase F1 delta subunit